LYDYEGVAVKGSALVLVLCMLFCLPFALGVDGYVNLTVLEAKGLMDSNPSLAVLDVRSEGEYVSGHLALAIHIPLDQLEDRLGELSLTAEILVYCASGGRSATASQLLAGNGFAHVYNMLGGITAWIDAGYPVYVKYPSLQEAINMTHPGGTLFVGKGVYNEQLTIGKPLKLVGEEVETAVIDGEALGSVVRVEADGVALDGFTIRNSGCPCEGNSAVYIGSHHRNVNITDNLITLNDGHGISVHNSEYVRLVGNTVKSNSYGIVLDNATLCTVADNTISNITNFGVYLGSSSGNILVGNDIADSLYGVGLVNAGNNTFYHNNLLNNAEQVYTYQSENTWDNGCEGNYWSNYDGVDLDGDGVGDTSIPWEGVDDCPLISVYWSPGDVDHDLDVDIFDVVRVASAYDCTPLDPNWNPHCDIAQPYGIISIYDVVRVACNYGEEYDS
jgi:parallel beta-helix repeat protein